MLMLGCRGLTNRFRVAVFLFIDKSLVESVLWSVTEQTHGNMKTIWFTITQKQTDVDSASALQ